MNHQIEKVLDDAFEKSNTQFLKEMKEFFSNHANKNQPANEWIKTEIWVRDFLGYQGSILDFFDDLKLMQSYVGNFKVLTIDLKHDFDEKFEKSFDFSYLSKFNHIHALKLSLSDDVESNMNFNEISSFNNLILLKLFGGNNSIDCSGLNKLSQLKTLLLAYTKVKDINFLHGLKNLNHLNLCDCVIENVDFSIIGNLTELKSLDLLSEQLDNIDFLIHLTKLERLVLNHSNITNIEILKELPNLKFIEITNCNQLSQKQILDVKNHLNIK